jgi:hypothetical protein
MVVLLSPAETLTEGKQMLTEKVKPAAVILSADDAQYVAKALEIFAKWQITLSSEDDLVARDLIRMANRIKQKLEEAE